MDNKVCGSFRARIALGLTALAFLGVAVVSAAPYRSQLLGEMPEFKGVFIKLFQKSMDLASLDQIKKMHSELTSAEAAALANYMPQSEWEKVLAKTEDAKKSFLLGKYREYAGKAKPSDFKKNFPKILAVNINVQNMAQYKESIEFLSEKEMAALGFYMGNDGLAVLFKNMEFPKHQLMLETAPDWMLLELGLREYSGIRDYTCVLLKQERVGGKLQGVETIELKYREKPHSVYMKWVAGPFTGREALYNESVHKDKIRVREGGALGITAVTIPLDSAIAKRGTNHLMTEVGLKYLLQMIRTDWKKSYGTGDMTRKNIGIEKVDGHNCFVMDSIMKKNPRQGYYCHRLRHYIDYERSLEIKAEVFGWDNKLNESYTYTKLKINPGLKDIDFDQNNKAYKL